MLVAEEFGDRLQARACFIGATRGAQRDRESVDGHGPVEPRLVRLHLGHARFHEGERGIESRDRARHLAAREQDEAVIEPGHSAIALECGIIRRVRLAGCTAHPDAEWVTQQARQVAWTLGERIEPVRFLIRDHDYKFTTTFDAVFESQNTRIIRTPIQVPEANGIAERLCERRGPNVWTGC